MAVSVRLPDGTGPYIEHYLIISENGVLSLESSRFEFNSIPALIDHYAKCWYVDILHVTYVYERIRV